MEVAKSKPSARGCEGEVGPTLVAVLQCWRGLQFPCRGYLDSLHEGTGDAIGAKATSRAVATHRHQQVPVAAMRTSTVECVFGFQQGKDQVQGQSRQGGFLEPSVRLRSLST